MTALTYFSGVEVGVETVAAVLKYIAGGGTAALIVAER